MPGEITLRDPDGRAYLVPEDQVSGYVAQGFTVETSGGRADRLVQEDTEARYGGAGNAAASAIVSGLGTVTGGLTDAATAALGGGEALRRLHEEHPIASTIGGVAGAFVPTGIAGLAGKAGTAIRAGEEAGVLATLGRGALAGAVEGGIYGAGQTVSELALDREPLTMERAASALSSNLLFGGAVGAGAGLAGSAVERVLGSAQRALDRRLGRGALAADANAAVDAAPDLATLDGKGLRDARKTEVESINKARDPDRKQFVDDLGTFRQDALKERSWQATEGSGDREARALGKISLDADRAVDRLLRNPISLAEKPEAALKPLQQQQHALQEISKLREAEEAAWDAMPDTIRDEILAGKVKGETGPFHEAGLDAAVQREMERRFGPPTSEVTADNITPKQLDMLTEQYRAELAADRASAEADAAAKRAAVRDADAADRAFTDPARVRDEIRAGKVKGETGPFHEYGLDAAVERELARRGVTQPSAGLATDEVQALINRQRQAAGLGEFAPRDLAGAVEGDIVQRGAARPGTEHPLTGIATKATREAEAAAMKAEEAAAAAERAHTKELLERPLSKDQVQKLIDASPDFRNYARPARLRAHDKIPLQLERNLALQAKIGEIISEPVSERLAAIDKALEAANAPHHKTVGGTLGEKLLHAVPGGRLLGELAEIATQPVGSLRTAANKAARKTAETASALLSGTRRAVSYTTPLATKVLASIAFGPTSSHRPTVPDASKLTTLFHQRADEIKAQTAYDATGVPRIRPVARAAIAKRLQPLAMHDPVLADRLESLAVRRLEYLSSILPRRPEIGGVPTGGPDSWKPSDMEMRAFARACDAVERPGDVERRILAGTLTPEDVTSYWAVYPERGRHFQQQVMTELPKRSKPLPIAQRISLGMFIGQALDPSLDPKVLGYLQSQFTDEPGTSGGTQAPKAQPQFGSIKKSVDSPTPAQARGQGAQHL